MSRQLDGVNQLKHIDFPFNWSDGAGALILCNESGKPMIFARAAIIQGGTAGSVTAGVYTLELPTSIYVITTPAAFGPGEPAYMDAIGHEEIPVDGVIQGTVTTPSGSAKEATLRIYYWGE